MSEIVVGQRELSQKFRQLAKLPRERRVKVLMKGGAVIERAAKQNIKTQGLIDTRNLTGATTAEPEGDDAVTIGPRNVVYAAIHEFGGTITPKNKQYLAVPLKKGDSPKNYGDDLHVVPFGGMVAGLVDSSGSVKFLLVKSVMIPARPYLRPAFDENIERAEQAIGDELASEIERVAAG